MTLISPRPLLAAGTLLPLGAVAFAVTLTQFYNIAACPLCVVQRMIYLLVAALFAFGLIADRQEAKRLLISIASICTAGGAALAGYQLYLQHHPFSTCGNGSSWWEKMVEQAGNLLPVLFKANGLCSDATQILGLSIVEWSLIGFIGLLLLSLLTLWSLAAIYKRH